MGCNIGMKNLHFRIFQKKLNSSKTQAVLFSFDFLPAVIINEGRLSFILTHNLSGHDFSLKNISAHI
jgi:hypothetical protein